MIVFGPALKPYYLGPWTLRVGFQVEDVRWRASYLEFNGLGLRVEDCWDLGCIWTYGAWYNDVDQDEEFWGLGC